MKENALVGQTVVALWLSSDREAIRFTLADGRDVVAYCDADCCSHTWIEDVLDPDVVLGTVTRAEAIELPEQLQAATKTENYEEEMAYYGFAIETERGRCTIAYRNSSNGYYGGSLNWPGDYGHDRRSAVEPWQPVVPK
jgi:hypothetical protein